MENNKTYLGDGVYVKFDGYQLWLTAENGVTSTDTIALEPPVWRALKAMIRFVGAIPHIPQE